jgi:hypothetical protein
MSFSNNCASLVLKDVEDCFIQKIAVPTFMLAIEKETPKCLEFFFFVVGLFVKNEE